MTGRNRWIAAAGFTLALLVSSTAHADEPSQLVAGSNAFGFALLSALTKAAPNSNVFISPLGLTLALSMTANGADGGSRTALLHPLGAEGLSNPDRNAQAKALSRTDTGDAAVQLSIANSIWVKKGYSFSPTFKNVAVDSYRALAQTLDFSDPYAIDVVNKWTGARTNNQVPGILQKLDPNSIVVLLDAVYFHADWSAPFVPSKTQHATFYGPIQERVPMMYQQAAYRYEANDEFQGVSLPYGSGRYEFDILLPKVTFPLSSITSDSLAQLNVQTSTVPGYIGVPRANFRYGAGLKPSLTELGMSAAFDYNKAKFSSMFGKPTGAYLSRVEHHTGLALTETGTVATASTAAVMNSRSANLGPRGSFRMVMDHPFFIAIRDRTTGAILFCGDVYEPLPTISPMSAPLATPAGTVGSPSVGNGR